jgi:hypothetical protein
MTWPLAFVWTFALEQPFYLLALRGRAKSWWEAPAFCLAANLLTHPLVWTWAVAGERSPAQIRCAELLVAAAEGALLAALLLRRGDAGGWSRGMLSAAGANGFSWLAGGALLERLLH